MKAYQYEDDKLVVEWLEKQIKDNSDSSAVMENIRCLQRDHVLSQIRK